MRCCSGRVQLTCWSLPARITTRIVHVSRVRVQQHALSAPHNIIIHEAESSHQQEQQAIQLPQSLPQMAASTQVTAWSAWLGRKPAARISVCAVGLSLALLLLPGTASASGGELTGQAAQMFAAFLEYVEGLGPAGAVVFVLVVTLFEMVPLFPTQPLSLASGLLFGPQKGAMLMLLAVTLAAVNAFLIARGVGRPLAQKIIDAEMGHSEKGGQASGVAKAMANIQATIESGGLWKQMAAVVVLRLTPVVPFSASNYLLGLTPLQLPALIGGTMVGMSFWSIVYASLGGASRSLLDGGADIGALLSDLGTKAAGLSGSAAQLTLVAVGVGAVVWGVRSWKQQQQQPQPSVAASTPSGNPCSQEGGSDSTPSAPHSPGKQAGP
mmetsp:Transcript_18871/g.32260  ORF Transcript_18871/g.32260 Transcript_18871/m.32260 type:complete len:382 (+) Transcript_18871:79-1224(+)|eukprot:CAMPEP_0119105108 /NCGR_PEP_ID=MMETSP1180-20130426/3167_1 /TAXON_ID=3052 ORGANISM="Chlamydomonas cf sp, Strain CCMP681" /NCGR_SAMPLE_ID=MMETSP1180 /ASSEMBLY_ACC=CAM_ASM_000741 /LENGTH=381 /DNA_ID=CAMNT_0007090085 /DNA_START=38 /DNA_END=1183 /DNA_ORIENTATION=+